MFRPMHREGKATVKDIIRSADPARPGRPSHLHAIPLCHRR